MNRIAHTEARYYGKKIIIDTAQLPDGSTYETIVMYPDGFDLDIRRTADLETAKLNHAAAVDLYERLEKARPLKGKYAQLAADLRAAADAAFVECSHLHDGGTCNFDAPSLYLPRWNAYEVERAARSAGLRCFDWKICGQKRTLFSVPVPGQGARRTAAAKRMTESLKAAGYDAAMYYQID